MNHKKSTSTQKTVKGKLTFNAHPSFCRAVGLTLLSTFQTLSKSSEDVGQNVPESRKDPAELSYPSCKRAPEKDPARQQFADRVSLVQNE